jgi:hypothetical protein
MFYITIDNITEIQPTSEQFETASTMEIALDILKRKRSNLIQSAYNDELNGRFESDALGQNYYYASEPDDQQNLIGAVTTGQDIPFKVFVSKIDNIGQFVSHTHSQLQQALNDGALVKLTLMQKRDTLNANIQSATTKEQVISYVW